jgi:hypothetical protein
LLHFLLRALCNALVFVATRHLFARALTAGVMHLFVGRKLEIEKPRRYPARRKLLANFVAFARGFNRQMGRTYMDALGKVNAWIGGLTEIGLMLLALAIVAALLVGSNLPFFGNVTGNIMALVKSLGDAGLVGLIALGVILWLFSSRKMA